MLCPFNGESKKNVFRRIICSFTVTDQICGDSENRCLSCLHYFRPPEEQKYGQIWRPHSEPYKFLLHILKNNSAAENWTEVRLGQVVNLSIFKRKVSSSSPRKTTSVTRKGWWAISIKMRRWSWQNRQNMAKPWIHFNVNFQSSPYETPC